jgi:transcriptional regulator with XRE-family HTH domain
MGSYEEWSVSQISKTPTRSHLYHLAPIGVGTPYVESLSSYVIRLAEAHCVNPVNIISAEILQCTGTRYWRANDARDLGRLSRMMNGTGCVAVSLRDALQKLTLRVDLTYLTMIPWKEVVPHRGLLRASQSWCPICFSQWARDSKVIYNPLLWSLQAIEVCPEHNCLLMTNCPTCHSLINIFCPQSRMGFCSHCGHWLADDSRVNNYAPLSGSSLNIAKTIAGLLANSTLYATPSREKIAASLASCIAQWNGNLEGFANFTRINKNLLSDWLQGRHIPELASLSKVCIIVGVSLTDFLLKQPQLHIAADCSKRSDQGKGRLSLVRTYKELKSACRRDPPISLNAVAKSLGLSRSHVYRHFPGLCQFIIERYEAYKKTYFSCRASCIRKALFCALIKPEVTPIKAICVSCDCHISQAYRLYPALCKDITYKNQYMLAMGRNDDQHNLSILIFDIIRSLDSDDIYPSKKRIVYELKKRNTHGCDERLLRKQVALAFDELGISKAVF